MTRILSQNLHKAAAAVYMPMTKMSKQAKTLPILSHYHLFTRDGWVYVSAVDTSGNEWELHTEKATARVETEFDVCVPMRPFRDWLGVTAKYKSVLSLSVDGDKLTMTEVPGKDEVIAPSRVRFNCLPSAEFPSHVKEHIQ